MTTSKEIIEYFKIIDVQKKENQEHIRDTDKGIFGVSNLEIMDDFFNKIRISKEDVFVDLGSGDGRVNILASIYSKSIGIEFDKELVQESIKHNDILKTAAIFLEQDYESYDFSKTTILFSFADHFFNEKFIAKLSKEFKGTLYIYQGIFTPEKITKGKTIWINQTPIYSYLF
ncbi:hypothetical protein JXA48_03665 [Candidatus Woesearchaeota archaeon]|nr:hypothetical protein [Candidatus Woesearchaeota archaeon]